MNTLDYILVVIASYFILKGIYRGLIAEIFSLVALIAGFGVAFYFGNEISTWIIQIYPNFKLSEPLFFIILFILTALLVTLIGKIITKASKMVSLNLINRLLGGIFGALKSMLVFLLALYIYYLIGNSIDLPEYELVKSSKTIPIIKDLEALITQFIP